MATRKKTTRRARGTASSGGGALESNETMSDRTADYTPGALTDREQNTALAADGIMFRVRRAISDHPLLAVLGVAGLAVTVAIAARD
jgi:hypothetical protein